MDSNRTYIDILIQSLKVKAKVLDEIIEITKEQEKILSHGLSVDIDEFNRSTEKKGPLIDKINELNDGFESLFDKLKDEFIDNKNKYLLEIEQLQDLIREVTQKSAQIQVVESRNHVKLQSYLQGKRKEIKEYKKSAKMVSSYYQNMANQHQGQSYFLDKKK